MMREKSKVGAKPAGLVYLVVYTDDRQTAAAAFTSRERADDFLLCRSAKSSESACSMIETVVDGITGPTKE